MTDVSTGQSAILALLDAAERNITAARVLLGGGGPVAAAPPIEAGRRPAASAAGKCPACGEKENRVKPGGFGETSAMPDICGSCAYEYPKA